MVKIGTYYFGQEGVPFEESAAILRETGFDFLSFGVGSATNEGVRAKCERAGLEVGEAHLTGSGTHALWAEGEQGEEIAKRYCDEIELCGKTGVKTAVMHALYGYAQPAPMGELGLSRFSRIVECAEKNGVILGLENSLFDTYLCYVMDHIKSPNLGFCFDSGHHNAFARDMDLLGMYGDRLVATHLQDNDGAGDMHMYPLDGTADWDAIKKGLARTANARERICAEIVRVRDYKMKGLTAAEIEAKFLNARAYRDGLMRFTDEHVISYEALSYVESAQRLYAAMREIADAIEKGED